MSSPPRKAQTSALVALPYRAPTTKQLDYLTALSKQLGYPTGRAFAAEILHAQHWPTLTLSSAEVSRCIQLATARLAKQSGEVTSE